MRRSLIGLACAALALCVGSPPAFGSPTGTVGYGYSNDTWTQGRSAFSVTFDACGADGQPTCRWWGWATVQPAAFACPSFPEFLESGMQTVWLSTEQHANGTVESGEKTFYMNGAHGQRACLYYARQFTGTGVYAAWYAHGKQAAGT